MIKIFFLFFLYSCSQVSTRPTPPPERDQVSVDTALDHIRSSYLKGCVDAFKELKIPASFEHCRDKAKEHEEEVLSILLQPISSYNTQK